MTKAIIFDFFGVLTDEISNDPNTELLAYIKKNLKPKYKLGVISNANADWFYEILSKEDAVMFDDVVISHRVGHAKPEPAIYQLSLKNLGVRADESIFIDDIESFCEAAQSLGMKTITYLSNKQLISDLKKILS